MNAFPQRKEIAQAKTYIKSGKDIHKADSMMRKLLTDSANTANIKIWTTLFDAVKAQYEQGNEKLYLKQPYDTAALFRHARNMFLVAERIDSLDAMPDKHGTVKLKLREKHAEYLSAYRANLLNGGIFFVKKQRYDEAFRFFDTYIDCTRQPLFTYYGYQQRDTLLSKAAYWAVYSGYKIKNYDMVMKYAEKAKANPETGDYALQYIAEMYKLHQDSANYISTLKEGFARYPTFSFFFPRLIAYYESIHRPDSVQITVDKALAEDSTNQVFRLAKSTVLLNAGQYEECIKICNTLIAEDTSLAEAYCNLGLAYFNMAIALEKTERNTRSTRNKIAEYYTKSRPYMEKYRQLNPEDKEKWVPVLYTIYLNLNMGKEFDEIDRLRKK